MSGPRNAEERLARLLVMLPWLMEVGQVPLADVAARYDMTESQVQKDLELVAMCGLPPFVDEMIDVFVDDGLVFIGVPRLFTRPLRLTAPEAFSLLASARTAMELPGADPDGALGRGLLKLAAALSDVGVEGVATAVDGTAGVAIDLARPELTDEIAEAAATSAEVTISYYSPARDEVTDRVIVPRHVFAEVGNWYVVADDNLSGERRTFRIDRIEALASTGRVVPSEGVAEAPGPFFANAELPTAVLRLGPDAQWVLDRYPVEHVEPCGQPAGWVEARMPVANDRWLTRLLIRLGPHAVVVEPVDAAGGAAALAAKILANY